MSEYRRIDIHSVGQTVGLLVCKSVCQSQSVGLSDSVGDSVTRSLTVSDCLTNGRRFLSSRSHVYKETKSCKTLAYLPMLERLSAHDSRELP